MTQQAVSDFLSHADERFITAMNTHALLGMGVGIVQGAEIVYTQGFGLADVTNEQPVSPTTVFRVGTLSEASTAIGLLHLWEQQGFSLDAPVNEYLKHYQITHSYASAPPVTFRHLLTHTSGLGELRTWSDLFRPSCGLNAKPDTPTPAPWEYYARGLQPEVYPQMKVAPSAHTYNTIGQLIEDISGEPFDTYMQTHIFTPFGMHTSDYLLSDRVHPLLAQGYRVRKHQTIPVAYREIIPRAARALFSTVTDMCQYMVALLNGGTNAHGTLLQPETVSLLFAPYYQLSPQLPAVGMAFQMETWGEHRIAVLSADSQLGFAATMVLAPDDQLGIVLLTNTETGSLAPLAYDVLSQLLGLEDPNMLHPALLETPYLWQELCGFYGPDQGANFHLWQHLGGEVEVFVQNNRLHIRSLAGKLRHGVPLTRTDPSNPLVFETAPSKSVAWITGVEQPRLQLEFKRNHAYRIDRLYAGVDILYKRRWQESIRWKATFGGLGVLAGVAWAVYRQMASADSP